MVAKVAASVIARHDSNVSGAGYCRPMSMMLPPELEPGSGWGWRRTAVDCHAGAEQRRPAQPRRE